MKFFNLSIKFLIVFLITLIIGCVKNKNGNSEILKQTDKQTDSIKKIDLVHIPDIIGDWRLIRQNKYNRLFLYENNTWKMIFTDYKNDTLIEKGKYTIAKDSAVFFRYFGTLHWPNTDTINDYKTSLGAFVLFLNEKGQLKDNQEDYDQTYVKVN
ncbi:hypothetical protein [Christiangramia forsetii]|uniref:Lipocalin-like domain-containing protein n=2 Tax=Christiangramia forsetii TaxID=411153 RepID=A0LZP0_CHRFK|nr:hypothetical protein [Christiangramia forsetii]GGG46405.1 hypothetical protein GCM10011532_32850 [Christiangramia forsetii]CAL65835.1 hypothetical protein GFO_0861 [Christiangramia forsetii KT0803]